MLGGLLMITKSSFYSMISMGRSRTGGSTLKEECTISSPFLILQSVETCLLLILILPSLMAFSQYSGGQALNYLTIVQSRDFLNHLCLAKVRQVQLQGLTNLKGQIFRYYGFTQASSYQGRGYSFFMGNFYLLQKQLQVIKILMKQSYLRSKNHLKPIINAQAQPKGTVIDYQKYQEELENYQKKNQTPNIASLFDWSKPSEVISLLQKQKKQGQKKPAPPRIQDAIIENHSMNTEELLRSEGDHAQIHSDQLQDSIEIPPSKNVSFTQRINFDYGQEYNSKSLNQIESQLKKMRSQIIQMNEQLNRKLDRYQLLSKKSQEKLEIQNPYLFFGKQIQNNKQIISKQLYDITQLEQLDQHLDKKDYLVQFNQLIMQTNQGIHDLTKNTHNQWVDIQKTNKLITEIQQIHGTQEQFRHIKELKKNIVFYFKKLKQQKMIEQQLDKDQESLQKKDQQISKKLMILSKEAEQKHLQVSTNKPVLTWKKKYQELQQILDSTTKKKQIVAYSQKGIEQKLEKQISQMKRQQQAIQLQIQQYEYKSISLDEETSDLMSKHQIMQRQLKSISYRFDQSLIRPTNTKYKPDFKRKSNISTDKNNVTIDVSPVDHSHQSTKINDKNIDTFKQSQNIESEASSRIKPAFRQWKGKTQKIRYNQMQNSEQKYKTLQTSNIFKPSLLLKSKKGV